jgi:hypothetical protein
LVGAKTVTGFLQLSRGPVRLLALITAARVDRLGLLEIMSQAVRAFLPPKVATSASSSARAAQQQE